MASKWNEHKLEFFVEINPREPLPKGKKAKKISMDKISIYSKSISEFELSEVTGGARFRNNDTLLPKITPCLENGKIGFVDILEDGEIAFGSTEFTVLRSNDNSDPHFVYYFAKSPLFHKTAVCLMEGTSGRKRVNEVALAKRKFIIPDLPTQNAIARVLSQLDEKIELNNKINVELESIAKTLYDYWFVQFDFPDENGKAYRSNGGAMVYNPTLKREIPKGWTIDKLEDKLTFERGVEPGSSEYSTIKTNEKKVPFIRVSDLSEESTALFISETGAAGKYCELNDVLVSFDGSIGKYAIAMQGSYSSGIRKIKAKDESYSDAIIYFIFQSQLIQKTIGKNAVGSNILHASSAIQHLYFLYNKGTVQKYMNTIEPMFQQIIKNKQQNKQLAELRDFLLPLLMNGQVKVEE